MVELWKQNVSRLRKNDKGACTCNKNLLLSFRIIIFCDFKCYICTQISLKLGCNDSILFRSLACMVLQFSKDVMWELRVVSNYLPLARKKNWDSKFKDLLSAPNVELLVTFLAFSTTFCWYCMWISFIPVLLSVSSFVKPPQFLNIRQILSILHLSSCCLVWRLLPLSHSSR